MDYYITEEETPIGIKTTITFLHFVPRKTTLQSLRKFLKIKGEIISNSLVLDTEISKIPREKKRKNNGQM